MKVLESKKTTILLLILLSILLILLFIIKFEIIANYLYGDENPSNKGQLFGTTLTAIGGICVIWGLYLNNKKVNQQIRQVNEQVRQNDIAAQNSNDKRFGEAVGYLNDDNEGIAIGGVYALYQLAKEDERYAPIVTNIYCNYVNDNIENQNKKSYQTILSLLFSRDNSFILGNTIELYNISFMSKIIYCNWIDIKFDNCILDFSSINNIRTLNIKDCNVVSLLISRCKQLNICDSEFDTLTLKNCDVTDSIVFTNCNIKTLIIDVEDYNIKFLSFNNCRINGDIKVIANSVKQLIISKNDKSSTACIDVFVKKAIEDIHIDDKKLVNIYPVQD